LIYDSSGFESRPGSIQGGFFAEKLALKFNRSPTEHTVVCRVLGVTIVSYKNIKNMKNILFFPPIDELQKGLGRFGTDLDQVQVQ
jgi:hypothetical protein